MSVTISKRYLKREEKTHFYPTYIIAPPTKVLELEGYVLKILQDYVIVEDKTITLSRGNEWSKKEQKIFYTFEKEVKEKGRAFKKYRYTEEEVLLLYRKSEHKNFEQTLKKREETATKGPGSLIKASFTMYDEEYGYVQEKGWFIMSKADDTWVYPFDYEPLRDVGKHSTRAKGFSVLEEYPVQDIAILRTHAKELNRLTGKLDHYRGLKVGISKDDDSFVKYIVDVVLQLVPSECRDKKDLKGELCDAAKIIEEKCNNCINSYKKDEMKRVTEEIKNLIGVDIKEV